MTKRPKDTVTRIFSTRWTRLLIIPLLLLGTYGCQCLQCSSNAQHLVDHYDGPNTGTHDEKYDGKYDGPNTGGHDQGDSVYQCTVRNAQLIGGFGACRNEYNACVGGGLGNCDEKYSECHEKVATGQTPVGPIGNR